MFADVEERNVAELCVEHGYIHRNRLEAIVTSNKKLLATRSVSLLCGTWSLWLAPLGFRK